MVLMIAASAAVSVCTGAEALAAERLIRHTGASLAVASRPGFNPLTAWLSQVTHEVATGWHGVESTPYSFGGAWHPDPSGSESKRAATLSPVVAAARPHRQGTARPCVTDLPPPRR